MAQLRHHRRDQNQQRLELGAVWNDEDLVFCGPAGSPLDPRSVSRSFRRLAADAGLGPDRFHDLRHTAATQILRAGVGAKVVSMRLDHATAAFTLDTYAHVLPDMQEDAASVFDGVLRAGRRAAS